MQRLIIALFVFSLALVNPALATATTPMPPGPHGNMMWMHHMMSLTVTSTATVSSAPDVANIGAEMESTRDNAADATGAINAEYATLVSKLKTLGIKSNDIHTTWFNVNFVPKPLGTATPSPWGPRPGYTARRSIGIHVTNLENVGRVIDASVASGAKQITGVNFALSNDEKVHNEALAQAIKQARASANAMAAAAGVHVSHVLTISTGYAPQPIFRSSGPMMLSKMAVPAPPTQIDPQSLTESATVTVTFALRP